MKETFTLTWKLLLISAFVTALLAFVNSVTKPIIAENDQKNFEMAMAEVLPGAEGFEECSIKEFTSTETGVTLDSVHASKSGGYVVSTICSEGYGGDINVMVGIDENLSVTQIKIMSMSETPGLGAKATEPKFYEQYNGLTSGISVIKNAEVSGNQIAAISGATVTSKAVTKAVNTALEAATYVAEKGGN